MLKENIIHLSMPELFDLLMVHTKELIRQLDQRNTDGTQPFQAKTDVRLIQSVIEIRKSALAVLPLAIL